jgi:rhodanese-related sulfurtransferase
MFETLRKLFTPAQALEPSEVRNFFAKHKTGTYTLLDVRQPGEYEREHLPGATLIPLPQLGEAFDQLNPEKPVIVY